MKKNIVIVFLFLALLTFIYSTTIIFHNSGLNNSHKGSIYKTIKFQSGG